MVPVQRTWTHWKDKEHEPIWNHTRYTAAEQYFEEESYPMGTGNVLLRHIVLSMCGER